MRHPDDQVTLEVGITELADATGAPASFVSKVRALFEHKGISLHVDARPYLSALREAFRREETLRRATAGGERALARAREDLGRLDERWRRQIGQLEGLRDALRIQAQRLHEGVQQLPR